MVEAALLRDLPRSNTGGADIDAEAGDVANGSEPRRADVVKKLAAEGRGQTTLLLSCLAATTGLAYICGVATAG